MFIVYNWRHDNQYDDTQDNDTLHNNTQHNYYKTLGIIKMWHSA